MELRKQSPMIRATAAGVSAHAGLTCYFLISSFVVSLSVCLKIAYPPLAILIGRTWKGFTGFQATVLFVPFRLVENWHLGELRQAYLTHHFGQTYYAWRRALDSDGPLGVVFHRPRRAFELLVTSNLSTNKSRYVKI